jgi:hypothetical protein
VPDFVLVHLEDVFTFEDDLPGDDLAGGIGDEAEDRKRANALAATTLADESQDLPGLNVVADTVDCLHNTVFGVEVSTEVFYLEQRFRQSVLLWERPAARRALIPYVAFSGRAFIVSSSRGLTW